MMFTDWSQMQVYISQCEERGLVTRTFRRLDPQRQEAVVHAILDDATQYGPAGLNIKRVARRAGVSVGSLYQYFPDRDGMLAFAVELCVRYVSDAFNQYRTYMSALPLRAALSAYLVGGVEWSRTQAGFLRLFARAAYQGDPELAESLVLPIANLLREMVAEILSAARARGEIRPDVDLEAATRILHALAIAVGDSQLLPYLNHYFQVSDPSLSPERLAEAFLDFVVRGIGAG
ncbi:MAG: TetR/AcrR family transcriptional regulator [Anaerolineales bacterium]|nr:TetR/AcrR family transcriptional regulator [Anaerolineales bacterium]